MKVSDLMAALSVMDPNSEVVIFTPKTFRMNALKGYSITIAEGKVDEYTDECADGEIYRYNSLDSEFAEVGTLKAAIIIPTDKR